VFITLHNVDMCTGRHDALYIKFLRYCWCYQTDWNQFEQPIMSTLIRVKCLCVDETLFGDKSVIKSCANMW